MEKLFNRTFFNYTMTFLSIVIVAFSIAIVASWINGAAEPTQAELEAGSGIGA